MKQSEIDNCELYGIIGELRAWLNGLSTGSSNDIEVSYGITKIKALERKLLVFLPMSLKRSK